MFFFSQIYEKVEGGGGKGVHLRFSRNVFFHCGEAREGKGVMIFTKSLWDGERVHLKYDPGITSVMPWAVGCLTRENTKECWAFFAQCRVFFVDFFHF
jgi:hypothetical protein